MKNEKQLSKLVFTALITLFPFVTGHTQGREAFSFNSTINPSTETFSIAQYGKLSPSLYTGAMSFSIPVFTYEDPDFTIPISLDYSFSGYRPSVHSGTVGYGWALNCGGVITRDVIGVADDALGIENSGAGFAKAIHSGIFNKETDITNSKQIYLEEHIGDKYELSNVNVFSDQPNYNWKHLTGAGFDTCPDIFHFNFLGHTGDFMLTKDGSVAVFNSSHPYGEYKIEYDFNYSEVGGNYFSEIRIMTGDGYCYYFGGTQENVEFSKSSGASAYSVASWKLRKITAPNGNHIEFIYSILQRDFSIFEVYTPDIQAQVGEIQNLFSDKSSSQTLSHTNITFHYLLSGIKLNGTEFITFNYADKEKKENEDNDFNGNLQTWIHDPESILYDEMCLNSIHIRNASSQIVENIRLEHLYTSDSSGSSRMFLTKVSSKYNGSHLFDYEASSSSTFPKNDTNATDYWGFWNGKSNAFSLKNYIMNPVHGVVRDLYAQLNDSSVKSADFNYSKKGGLTGITYPTGGTSSIVYEPHHVEKIITAPNEYGNNSSNYIPGGVRVAKIINSSESITDSIRYVYSGGILTSMPRYAMRLEYNYRCRLNDPNNPGETPEYESSITAIGYTDDCSSNRSSDHHVTYSAAAVKYMDGSSAEYEYHDADDMPDWKEFYDNSSLAYSGVNVYNKDSYFAVQDMVYHNNGVDYEIAVKKLFLPNTDDFSRMRGQKKSFRELDCDGRLIRSIEYDYGDNVNNLAHTQAMVYNTLLDFTEAPLRIYAPLLRSETHTTMFENGPVMETITYSYNDKGQMTGRSRWHAGKRLDSQSIKYYTESNPTYDADTLRSAVSDMAYSKSGADGEIRVTDIIKYHYDDLCNPQPSRVTYYSSDNPAIEGNDVYEVPEGYVAQTITRQYSKDTQRLLREEYPGLRYHSYEWDERNRNIISRTSDSDENITRYSWFDMVGLYDITYPTGTMFGWGYDGNNRVHEIYDSNGAPLKRYIYHLLNP